jgi:hypothetical protein
VILVRAWIRQALGASGAALIVPMTMTAVLVLLTLAGGLGRIGSLGQAFSGPRLPAPFASADSHRATSPARSRQLLALGTSGGAAGSVTPGAQPGSPPGNRPSGRGGPGGPGRGSGGGSGSGAHGGGAGPGGSTPSPAGPPPPPQPSPGETLVDQLTGVATRVTSGLPAPAGPAVTQAVEAVGSAADQFAPLRPPGLAQAPAPSPPDPGQAPSPSGPAQAPTAPAPTPPIPAQVVAVASIR